MTTGTHLRQRMNARSIQTFWSIRYPLAAASVVLTIKLAYVLATPLRSLIMTPWLIDDSFITMTIARNIAGGRGYSLDGINPTTGSPLLWTLLTAANHVLLGSDAAVKAAVAESAILGAASTLVVFCLARRLYGRRTAWLAFSLVTLLCPLFFNALNGMETSVFTFLGLLSLSAYVWLIEDSVIVNGGRYLAVGLLLGATCLARADGLLLTTSVVAVEASRGLRVDKEQRWRRLLATGLLALGVLMSVGPVAVWCHSITGQLLPANQAGRRALAWGSLLPYDGTVPWGEYWHRYLQNAISLLALLGITSGPVILVALAAGRASTRRRGRCFACVAVIYIFTYAAALVVYQGYFPDVHGLRYLNLPAHLIAIMTAALIAELASLLKTAWMRRALLLAWLAVLVTSSAMAYQVMVARLQWSWGMRIVPTYREADARTWWSFLDWAANHLPDGTVVAAKDFGRLSYFTEVRVVDLAGIIDPTLIGCSNPEDMRAYLMRTGVEYVLLPQGTGYHMHELVRQAVDMELVEVAPEQECTGYKLYHVLWQ